MKWHGYDVWDASHTSVDFFLWFWYFFFYRFAHTCTCEGSVPVTCKENSASSRRCPTQVTKRLCPRPWATPKKLKAQTPHGIRSSIIRRLPRHAHDHSNLPMVDIVSFLHACMLAMSTHWIFVRVLYKGEQTEEGSAQTICFLNVAWLIKLHHKHHISIRYMQAITYLH